MNEDEATVAVIDALEEVGIPYMLVGSFSDNFYGVPRSTQDVDFVLQIGEVALAAFSQRLGSQLRSDPQVSFELVMDTTRNTVHLTGIRFGIGLFALSNDPHDQERFRRRLRVKSLGREVVVPTAEDVIITKLRWAVQGRRTKDRDDVRDVIAVQGDRIDWDYVHTWSERHGTREALDEIRRSIPPL
ncbi:MAG TPA: hypothetical protein VKD72_31305 [Gemmataceae bacterium]|nr:hypothetical protein [Gemmataceae bacterium]